MILNQHIDAMQAIALRNVAISSISDMITERDSEIEPLHFILGLKITVDKLFSEYNNLPIGYDYNNLVAAYERLQNDSYYQKEV